VIKWYQWRAPGPSGAEEQQMADQPETPEVTFAKGDVVVYEDGDGTRHVGFVVAWYVDKFTGTECVGIETSLGGDLDPLPASDFFGYGEEDRVDLRITDLIDVVRNPVR
jgi:hypothetical protein